MTQILKPGTGVLFMKVGVHAQESLESIIERKTKEIKDAGYAMWGYGGNTCHPSSMVRPFAESWAAKGSKIKLCMQEMASKHFAEPIRADQFSIDGIDWEDVPAPIHVRGSRYALVIEGLREEKFDLPLAQTRVAIGPSEGRVGSRYIMHRVDKACLEVTPQPELTNEEPPPVIGIGLVAELRAPYAVFLRNR
jgi:hypothetical protein